MCRGEGTSAESACKRLENHLRILGPDLEPRLNFPWERSKVFSAMFEEGGRGKPYNLASAVCAKMPRVVPPQSTQALRPGDVTQKSQDSPVATKPSALFERALGVPKLRSGCKAGVDRENAIWPCVLSHAPKASKLGASIWCVDGLDALPAISQTLAGKATSAILKRARFSAKYVRECTATHLTAFPVSIKAFIAFLKPLVSKGESSAIREAAETINFLEHVLGMEVEDDLLEHPWIKGALRGASIRISDPRRSRVLTSEEVLLLEGALIDELLDKIDAFALGVFLFQLYARARVSDLRNIAKLELDLTDGQGFIEVRTYDRNNCRLNSPGACLILVAPYKGIHSKPWGAAWVKAASAVGFNFEKGHRAPLLPRQAVDYSWSSEAVNASETTAWVREILMHLGVSSESACTFSSHGLKATALSWSLKRGTQKEPSLCSAIIRWGRRGRLRRRTPGRCKPSRCVTWLNASLG